MLRSMMDIDELMEVIRKRRNITKFKNDSVEEEDLKKILEAARWAPSSGNTQPWELIVIRDSDVKREIAKIYARAISGLDEVKELPDRYLDPPILIAICVDKRIGEKFPDFFSEEFLLNASTGTLIQNMWLAVTSMGLGMSMGSQPISAQDELRELLEIPEYLWVPEIVQIGYPKTERTKTERRELQEFVHDENLDESKLRKEP